MRPKVILNLLFILFCCTAVQAQTGRQITGKVIDAMGELPGVSVVIKGTTNGTTTDLNGEFKLDNVKNGDVLQFSFIGYKTENVKVGNQSKFDITMTENTQTLEEVTVVAVGYVRTEPSATKQTSASRCPSSMMTSLRACRVSVAECMSRPVPSSESA